MFIDSYKAICETFGEAPTAVLRKLGISTSSYNSWKTGGEPTNTVKRKLADYWEITIEELVTGKMQKPATSTNSEKLSDDEMRFLNIIRKLTPEKRDLVEQLAQSLRNIH